MHAPLLLLCMSEQGFRNLFYIITMHSQRYTLHSILYFMKLIRVTMQCFTCYIVHAVLMMILEVQSAVSSV